MPHHAADGYATPQLAGFVTAVCTGRDVGTATQRLLAVGHSSVPRCWPASCTP